MRELYPDIVPVPFEEYAKKFYSLEDPSTEVYYRDPRIASTLD